MWSDQGGPWPEEACGKLGQQEPSSRAELAADEGLSTALSASLTGPTPKPSKHLPFWQGLEQSCGWAREGPRCAGEYKLQICIQRRFSQAPSSHTAAPSLGSGDGSGPSRQVLMAVQLSHGLGCSCLGSKNQGRIQDRQRLISCSPCPLLPRMAQALSSQRGLLSFRPEMVRLLCEPWSGLICLRAEASGTGDERAKQQVGADCTRTEGY